MPNRRRINAPSVGRRSFLYGLAATAAAAPLASWGFRAAPALVESPGTSPIAATVNTAPLTDAISVLIEDAAVATQALADALHPLRGVVKEIRRPEKFSQFALTWQGDPNLDVFVRSERADGTWSDWFSADPHAPMSNDNSPMGTELLYVEPTNAVQVSTTGINLFGPGSGVNLQDIVGIDKLDFSSLNLAEFGLPLIKSLAELPKTDWTEIVSIPGAMALDSITAVFIDGNSSAGEVINPIAFESFVAGAPKVISRAAWGADESFRSQGVHSYQTFKGTCVHHTAGSNNYTESQAAGIVRGIYAYHANTLGWGDIGYNALVDKFGNIYEGRYGGLDKNVEGAHAGGFNDGTFGISMMGNFEALTPPAATINAVGEMIGWRMKVGGVDPMSTAHITSTGFTRARYAAGQTATLPAIFAHRDTGYTTCPGNVGYTQMDAIRAIAKRKFDGQDVSQSPDGQGNSLLQQLTGDQTGENANAAGATGAPTANNGESGQSETFSLPPEAVQAVENFLTQQPAQ